MAIMTKPESACQVLRTLDVIGEKWSLLIVRDALRGRTRFSEFRESLGAPTDILTARLARLVEGGVLEKRPYREAGSRERSSYHLTPRGEQLRVIVAAMIQWGDEFNPSPRGAAMKLVDRDGEPVELAYVGSTGEVLAPEDVFLVPGPAIASL